MVAWGLGDIRNRRKAIRELLGVLVAVRVLGRKTSCGVAIVLAFEIIISATSAVIVRQVLDYIFIGHRLRTPWPTVATGFSGVEEVVEQHEPLRQRMQAGRDSLAKQHQARVAVTLRYIAKHLIVGAVLLDDVDHMRDLAGLQTNPPLRSTRRILAA